MQAEGRKKPRKLDLSHLTILITEFSK